MLLQSWKLATLLPCAALAAASAALALASSPGGGQLGLRRQGHHGRQGRHGTEGREMRADHRDVLCGSCHHVCGEAGTMSEGELRYGRSSSRVLAAFYWNRKAQIRRCRAESVRKPRRQTCVHAFDFQGEHPYKKWTWNNKEGDWKGGFGEQVLGETWVSHHGNHKVEGCRGVLVDAHKTHEILHGVSDVFADSDVYTASPPPDATVIMLGQGKSADASDCPDNKREKVSDH